MANGNGKKKKIGGEYVSGTTKDGKKTMHHTGFSGRAVKKPMKELARKVYPKMKKIENIRRTSQPLHPTEFNSRP